jgi:hypothetical protein
MASRQAAAKLERSSGQELKQPEKQELHLMPTELSVEVSTLRRKNFWFFENRIVTVVRHYAERFEIL